MGHSTILSRFLRNYATVWKRPNFSGPWNFSYRHFENISLGNGKSGWYALNTSIFEKIVLPDMPWETSCWAAERVPVQYCDGTVTAGTPGAVLSFLVTRWSGDTLGEFEWRIILNLLFQGHGTLSRRCSPLLGPASVLGWALGNTGAALPSRTTPCGSLGVHGSGFFFTSGGIRKFLVQYTQFGEIPRHFGCEISRISVHFCIQNFVCISWSYPDSPLWGWKYTV